MWNHKPVAAAALLAWTVAGMSTASAQFPKQTGQVSQKDGDTTATASAKVSRQPNKGLIELSLRVKVTGVSGTGFGYAQVALLDKDNNTIYKTALLQKHRGSNALKGVAYGEADKDFEVPLAVLNRTAKAIVIVRANDRDGLDRPLESFKGHLDEAVGLLKKGNELKKGYMKLVGF